ncbi:unnamed protein product [Adineta ricciae]|uniref:Uncharacterized protein n=1 Tax=Adineta ricciae TaxID=249248 RepID=A0A815KR29_ADIRI|nr:unnamed protein product [Adineta ricciae]
MMLIKVIILLLLNISIAKSSHFYGGTITWKPMNNTATGSTIPVMFTQSYQFKRSISIPNAYDYCDQTIIMNQLPKIPNSGQTLSCVSSVCANYVPISINGYCTDFSVVQDSSSTQIATIQSITVGAKFCVAFRDASWPIVYSMACVGGCFIGGAGWSIVSCLDLTVRSNGFINTPPVATVISPVKVPINTTTDIKIPIIDADADYLRCRWSANTSTIDECGLLCEAVPGGTIDSTNCILTFNSSGKTMGSYYVVAMTVEDFSNATSLIPLSSVPIQFLIQIVSTPTCPLKPTISSILPKCTNIEVGVQFRFTLNITVGCFGTNVTDVNTNPPLYMYKGVLRRVGISNIWTIDETWIPASNQLGSQVFCAVATDSEGIPSDQYCLTFFVVPTGSSLRCPGETTTTQSITQTGNKLIDLRPIIGFILGLLVLSALCFCCYWWLFRLRCPHRKRKKISTSEHLALQNYHSKKVSSRKPTRMTTIEPPDRSSSESRATIITSADDLACKSRVSNDLPINSIDDELPQRDIVDDVSITPVERSSISSFTDSSEISINFSKTETPVTMDFNSSIRISENHSLSITKRRSPVCVNTIKRLSTSTKNLTRSLTGHKIITDKYQNTSVSVVRKLNTVVPSKHSSSYRNTRPNSLQTNKDKGNVTVTRVIKI